MPKDEPQTTPFQVHIVPTDILEVPEEEPPDDTVTDARKEHGEEPRAVMDGGEHTEHAEWVGARLVGRVGVRLFLYTT